MLPSHAFCISLLSSRYCSQIWILQNKSDWQHPSFSADTSVSNSGLLDVDVTELRGRSKSFESSLNSSRTTGAQTRCEREGEISLHNFKTNILGFDINNKLRV